MPLAAVEWKDKDNVSVTLLEACIFDVKDSLLTKQHQTDLENGSYDGGKEPSLPKSRVTQAKKDVSIASQFGKIFCILEFRIISHLKKQY